MKDSLSIVMPAFNEGQILSKTVPHCHQQVLSHFERGEIIIVDDCSTDNTGEVVKELVGRFGNCIRLIRNQENLGHGPSLIKGLNAARYNYIFVIDSDYQHIPHDFWKLFSQMNNHHVATGLRSHRKDPRHRLILSKYANRLIASLFQCKLKDMNIPFKLFQKECLDTVLPYVPRDFKVPSILLVAIARKMDFRIAQLEVTHLPRGTGKCSLRTLKLLSFSCGALAQFVAYRLGPWRRIGSGMPV